MSTRTRIKDGCDLDLARAVEEGLTIELDELGHDLERTGHNMHEGIRIFEEVGRHAGVHLKVKVESIFDVCHDLLDKAAHFYIEHLEDDVELDTLTAREAACYVAGQIEACREAAEKIMSMIGREGLEALTPEILDRLAEAGNGDMEATLKTSGDEVADTVAQELKAQIERDFPGATVVVERLR